MPGVDNGRTAELKLGADISLRDDRKDLALMEVGCVSRNGNAWRVGPTNCQPEGVCAK